MKSPTIVQALEHPLAEFSSTTLSAREVVLAGLGWPMQYWCELAVGWLEQGFPLDREIVERLAAIAENRSFSQRLRHRARALQRRAVNMD
ncbi:hypothetical protein [Burkholderia ubonensis]|uniref:hypothetical protein n=1 Tax=Burkholderia ubonensis TaxID=101571 RepID=UPI0012F981F9|nr:hypothetical protein [Burkholderia ubonensis]